MGNENPGVRDGSGPFKGSFQRENSDEGNRKESGEECPVDKE